MYIPATAFGFTFLTATKVPCNTLQRVAESIYRRQVFTVFYGTMKPTNSSRKCHNVSRNLVVQSNSCSFFTRSHAMKVPSAGRKTRPDTTYRILQRTDPKHGKQPPRDMLQGWNRRAAVLAQQVFGCLECCLIALPWQHRNRPSCCIM